MKIEDLEPLCKIKNKDGYELIIDKIIGDEIYTSGRNMPLSKFDRLRRTKQIVEKQIENLGRLLLDGRIRITKKELEELIHKKISTSYRIKEFLEQKDKLDDSLIVKKKLKKGQELFTNQGLKFKFVGYVDGITMVNIFDTGGKDASKEEVEKINILIPDDLLDNWTLNAPEGNTITLKEVAKRLYDSPVEVLLITDL